MNNATETKKDGLQSKPSYVPPMIKLMEEKDLLAEFQVSVNAASWWGAM